MIYVKIFQRQLHIILAFYGLKAVLYKKCSLITVTLSKCYKIQSLKSRNCVIIIIKILLLKDNNIIFFNKMLLTFYLWKI